MLDFYINETIFEIDEPIEEEKEIDEIIIKYYLSPPPDIEKIILKKLK